METSKTSCHICGEPATRTHRGYPLCDGCEWCLDEILSIDEDAFLWKMNRPKPWPLPPGRQTAVPEAS
jgi:hypothetical protein